MRLGILYSPWRNKYITTKRATDGCIFCNVSNPRNSDSDDAAHFVAYRGKYSFVIMNLYPYSNGHVMVIPYAHESSYHLVDEETHSEMNCFARKLTEGLSLKMNAQGFNIGFNIGEAGGAGIAPHIHMHIVPRWRGDTNFMPTIANTKVISQNIHESFEIVRSIFI